MWENHTTYWERGVWNGKIFANVAEMSANYMYDFGFYSKGSYKYFTYSAMHGFTALSRFVMDKSGEIRMSIMLGNNDWSMIWQKPRDQCEVYAVCGYYGLCNNNNVQSCNCVPGFIPTSTREWESQQWSSGSSFVTLLVYLFLRHAPRLLPKMLPPRLAAAPWKSIKVPNGNFKTHGLKVGCEWVIHRPFIAR